ncbi:hypothetical protein Pcinc_031616 [Petrolisthes cinctipes]|uniref:Uncharacterized protein n=1 Tax=Petrolisthes cinctipes TaxID=88211 RepID=A0AAE1EVU0_PETCI|nr:hypothetical protein Pcinc_031616 [Petrolisthes cinctipes]
MSGDGSVEVSVPTDLTVTSDGDSEEGHAAAAAASRRHARELQNLVAEKLELQKTVEKQKLELQTKDAQLAVLVKEQEATLINVVAQKDDQISTKKIHITRLEVELTRVKEELSTIRERAARELVQLTQKCAVFQKNQQRMLILSIRQEELRESLSNLQLSEEQFTQLRHTTPQQLTLQQFTALRVYELVWPLRLKLNETEAHKLSLESALNAKNADLKTRNEQCTKLQNMIEDLQRKNEHYANQLLILKDEQRSDDFKVRNYARLKSERNQYEEEKIELTKKNSELELTVATLKKERSILDERCCSLKEKLKKLEHDVNEYQEDNGDMKVKLERVTEQVNTCEKQLRLERERNHELHEKYVAVRGSLTSLNEASSDNHNEIKVLKDKLQSSTLQASGLQEKVNILNQQNNLISTDLGKLKIKYSTETKSLDTEIKDLRDNMSSLAKNREILLLENSKLHQGLQSLEESYQNEKSSKEKEIAVLTTELQRIKSILSGLDELEDEYDKNIRTAAHLSEAEVNKLLPGIRVRGDKALARIIDMTRRLLVLERHNIEACATIQQLTESLNHLKNTTSSYKTALGMAGQPTSNLLQRIASQDDQITSLQTALHHTSLSKNTLDKDNRKLSGELVKLKSSLDKMIEETKELNAIKKQLNTVLSTLPQVPVSHTLASSQAGDIPTFYRVCTEGVGEDTDHHPSARAIRITNEAHTR